MSSPLWCGVGSTVITAILPAVILAVLVYSYEVMTSLDWISGLLPAVIVVAAVLLITAAVTVGRRALAIRHDRGEAADGPAADGPTAKEPAE